MSNVNLFQFKLFLTTFTLLTLQSCSAEGQLNWKPPTVPPSAAPTSTGLATGHVRSLFGKASDFLKRLGFHYSDVYDDQLLFTVLNTYENEEQRQEEIQQHNLMAEDATYEYHYALVAGCLMGATLLVLLFSFGLQLRAVWETAVDRRKRRTIEDFTRQEELRTLTASL